VMCRYRWIFLS